MTTTTSRLVGLQKTSMIDYPGKLAAVLFFPGCNLRCPYCHNAPLAAGSTENMVTLDEAVAYLDRRKDDLDGVVITGGEPLLQEGIFDLIQQLQRMGYSVKLDTNGTVRYFWQMIKNPGDGPVTICPDYVAIDLKGLPDDVRGYEKEPFTYEGNLAALATAHKTFPFPESIRHVVKGEVRTTVHKAATPDLRMLKEAWKDVIDGLPWYLQQYRKCEGFDPSLQNEPTYSDEELADIAIGVGAHIRGVRLDLIEYVESKLEEKQDESKNS